MDLDFEFDLGGDPVEEMTLKLRFKGVMRGLTCTRREPEGRIHLNKVSSVLAAEFEEAEQIKSLRLYRNGKRVPDATKAWTLGEALRKHGVPWCSGLWMLWICGHYSATVCIIADVLKKRPHEADAFWHMLFYADALARITEVDSLPVFSQIRVARPLADLETVDLLQAMLFDSDPPHPIANIVYNKFLRREIAKSAWLGYDSVQGDLVRAFENYNLNAPLSENPDDLLLRATLVVAKTPMPWRDHELILLTIFASWLNTIEKGGDSIVLPRPIRGDLIGDEDGKPAPDSEVHTIRFPGAR